MAHLPPTPAQRPVDPFFLEAEDQAASPSAPCVAAAYTFWPRANPFPFNFEVTMQSSLSGFSQLYYDIDSVSE